MQKKIHHLVNSRIGQQRRSCSVSSTIYLRLCPNWCEDTELCKSSFLPTLPVAQSFLPVTSIVFTMHRNLQTAIVFTMHRNVQTACSILLVKVSNNQKCFITVSAAPHLTRYSDPTHPSTSRSSVYNYLHLYCEKSVRGSLTHFAISYIRLRVSSLQDK